MPAASAAASTECRAACKRGRVAHSLRSPTPRSTSAPDTQSPQALCLVRCMHSECASQADPVPLGAEGSLPSAAPVVHGQAAAAAASFAIHSFIPSFRPSLLGQAAHIMEALLPPWSTSTEHTTRRYPSLPPYAMQPPHARHARTATASVAALPARVAVIQEEGTAKVSSKPERRVRAASRSFSNVTRHHDLAAGRRHTVNCSIFPQQAKVRRSSDSLQTSSGTESSATVLRGSQNRSAVSAPVSQSP